MALLKTVISEVVVYPDRARITRLGTGRLEPGSQRLEIAELPSRFSPESLRASAWGTAGARLLGVQVQQVFTELAQVEQIRALESDLEEVQEALRAVESQMELICTSRANLSALAGHTQIYATALASGEMGIAAHLELMSGLRAQAERLDAELREQEARKRDLERRQAKIKNELERFRGTPRRESYSAVIEVELLEAGELQVELSYVVAGAGWQPLYDLRLLEAPGQPPVLEAGYLAQVSQRSGEEWQEVSLKLSTARPALAGRLPELGAWYIRPYQAVLPGPELRMAVAAAPAPAQAVRAKGAEGLLPVEEVMAEVDASGAAVTYLVPGKVIIPADGAPHKVNIARLELHPELDYVTAPKIGEAVYRRARVHNDSPYTFLPGAANLFAGGEFIGGMQLKMIAPGEEIELFLGSDDRLKVERRLKRREVDKRLIGGKRLVAFGYEIKLQNLLPTPARVELLDHIPVARHEDIRVKLESAAPRPAEQDELNRLKWVLELAAGQTQEVRYDFSVEYPKEMEVVGLP